MRLLAVYLAVLSVSAREVAAAKMELKAYNGKVYVHIMPWFETKESQGSWGIHWTMANKNPDIVDGSGRREIAAHYYPEIGPYASGDPAVVEYQLLLMKYAGVDGVLIDWPGTVQAWDYPSNLRNTEAIIQGCKNVGLEYAIVYEDHNIKMAYDAGFIPDMLAAARKDMEYLRDRYFSGGNYIYHNGAPLLLVFGPQAFKNPSEWSNIFSVLPQKPHFLTLWYQSQEAAGHSAGEYCWIYFDFLDGLRHYYNNHQPGFKMGGAYPGFHTFYAQGGWPGPDWGIPVNTGTWSQTLDLAIGGNVPMIQLNTWNDYGEGTMLEPTREFGNQFLTILQQKISAVYGEDELNLVKALYDKRVLYKGDAAKQAELDLVAADLIAVRPTDAKVRLSTI
jgi:hypothetical protein